MSYTIVKPVDEDPPSYQHSDKWEWDNGIGEPRATFTMNVISWDGHTLVVSFPTIQNEQRTLTPFGHGNPAMLNFTVGQQVIGHVHTHQLDDELDEERAPGVNTMEDDWYHIMSVNVDLGPGCENRWYYFQMSPALQI